ncbi:MAG: hypothetical protein HGB12_13380 [Bacteroidetes bacterium]|nr:hypothetical protein [Bacteroidota bacterium]
MENDKLETNTSKKSGNVFSSDYLKSIISFSTSIFLVLGIIRYYIFFKWFNVPFVKFFNISDYLTTSIECIIYGVMSVILSLILAIYYSKTKKPYTDNNLTFAKKSRKFIAYFILISSFLLVISLELYLKIYYNRILSIFFYISILFVILAICDYCFDLKSSVNNFIDHVFLLSFHAGTYLLIFFLLFIIFLSMTISEIGDIDHCLSFHQNTIEYTLKEDNPKYKTAIILSISSDYVFLINPKREVFVLPKDSFKEFKVN